MKTAKQLREELAALSDSITAITDLCKAENREPSADETAKIDAALGTSGKDGQVAAIKASIERADRLEAEAKERAALLAATPLSPSTGDGTVRVKDETLFYRPTSLKAFKGADAEAKAHKCGRYAAAVIYGHEPSRKWCAENGISGRFLNAHQENSNELGGYLVIPEFERAIIDLREEYGVFRREAKVTSMASDTKMVPRRATGLTAAFVGEAGTMNESTKTWNQIQLVAKKAYVLSRYSSELNEDAYISIGEDLASEGAYALTYLEDNCGFNGDGTSTYGQITGLANALNAGSIYTALAGNVDFGTLDFADFEGIMGRIPTYVRNPKWYISKVGYYASMKRLLDAAGGNSIADLIAGAPLRFLGLEVVISNLLPTTLTGTTGTPACYVGDLSMACLLGDRRGVTVKRSEDFYFSTEEIGIRMTERFDINIHEKGTATAAGPIQQLKFA